MGGEMQSTYSLDQAIYALFGKGADIISINGRKKVKIEEEEEQ